MATKTWQKSFTKREQTLVSLEKMQIQPSLSRQNSLILNS
jgi:hypothetical protein